jgi:hypothetical protein
LFAINRANAGAIAQLDVKVEAGAIILAINHPITAEKGEDFAQHVQCLVYRPDRGVRTKIAGAIPFHTACHRHFGEIILPMDFDVGVTFIIFQADIVFGLVLLDEGVFQKQGFQFTFSGDNFNICYFAAQVGRLDGIDIFMELGTDPAAQINGFADVNDLVRFVFMDVDAGLDGQIF